MPVIPSSPSSSEASSSSSSSKQPPSQPSASATNPSTTIPLSLSPHSSSTSYTHTANGSFIENKTNRVLFLRGVNLSGSSKAPIGYPSHILDDFWESAERGGESFIGQPLDIDDGSADVHLARLKGWGFNFLRFPVTWESLERMGPKKYDYEFMDYIIRVLCKCREYGFKVYMDPHQDTWSRFSGGSGAPFWTLPACGIDPSNITATQASIIHSEYPLPTSSDPSSLPAMIWSTNYGRLLCQTIFTLFFAGRDFAPNCIIDNVNIQDWLQGHFIESFGKLAERIRDFDGGSLLDETVIGWDSLNEPYEGLCGWFDLNRNPTKQGSTLKKGTYPTPAQSFRLGMGQAQTVEHWTFGAMGPTRDGSVTIDPKGRKLWADPVDDEDSVRRGEGEGRDGVHRKWGWKRDTNKWKLGMCPWALHGVWDVGTGFVLDPTYFVTRPGTTQEVEFIADYWKSHFIAYTTRIRAAHPHAILFIQPPVFARPPDIEEDEYLKGRAVYAPHYYDGFTLITKHWNWFNADALGMLRGKYRNVLASVKVGEGAIRKSLREQLGYLKEDALIFSPVDDEEEEGKKKGKDGDGEDAPKPMPRYPTVIGEIGTPFDMDNKKAYGYGNPKAKGDYTSQERALDASLNASDGINGLSWTVWTYVGVVGSAEDGAHSHEWGDAWNGEDLSLWSGDDLGVDQWGEWDEGWFDDVGGMGMGLGGGGLGGGGLGGGGGGESLGLGINMSEDVDSSEQLLVKPPPPPPPSSMININTKKPVSRQPSSKSLMKAINTASANSANPTSNNLVNYINSNYINLNNRATARRMGSEISLLPILGGGGGGGTGTVTTANSIKTKASMGSVGVGVNASLIPTTTTSTIMKPHIKSSSSSSSLKSSKSSKSSKSTSSSSTTTTTTTTTYKPTTPERLAGYTPHPLLFLTNGARAYRAFVRPYPMKTVGRVVSVDFDIGKAWVKVVVRAKVGGNRQGNRGNNQGERGDNQGEDGGHQGQDGDGGEGLPTEIFVPLVHYAHPRLLEGLFDPKKGWGSANAMTIKSTPRTRNRNANVMGGKLTADANGMAGKLTPARSVSPSDASRDEDSGDADADADSHVRATSMETGTTSTAVESTSTSSLRNRKMGGGGGVGKTEGGGVGQENETYSNPTRNITNLKSAPDPIANAEEPLVDLDVWVSEGRWDVQGQVLRWWYEGGKVRGTTGKDRGGNKNDKNNNKNSGQGEAGGEEEREFTIEIRRKGGAMKGLPEKLRKRNKEIERKVMMSVNNGDGLRDGKGKGKARESEQNLCERMCPSECVVM